MRRRVFVQLSGLSSVYAGVGASLAPALGFLAGCTTGEASTVAGRREEIANPGSLAPRLTVGAEARAFAGDGTSAGLVASEHLVRLYGPSGVRLATIGDRARVGSGDVGTFNAPIVAVWGERLYVLETGNARIQAFGASGQSHGVVTRTSLRPSDLALDPGGNFHVAAPSAHRIEVFDPTGRPLRTIGAFGLGRAGLNGPRSVALAEDGLVHVVDTGSATVKVFTDAGAHVRNYGDTSGDARLVGPCAIRFDSEGRAWVADVLGAAIRIYDRNGGFVEKVSPRLPDGRAGAPTALSAEANGTMYAAVIATG